MNTELCKFSCVCSLVMLLQKVSELYQMLVQAYIPKQEKSIDESLIAYKGQLGGKQYIPSKKARFGIKLFQLCESGSKIFGTPLLMQVKTHIAIKIMKATDF